MAKKFYFLLLVSVPDYLFFSLLDLLVINVVHMADSKKLTTKTDDLKPVLEARAFPVLSLSNPIRRSFTTSKKHISTRLLSGPPAMTPFQRALVLLGLQDLSDLENKFLAKDAFLTPWSDFRDSFLLLQPAGMPTTSLPGRLTRQGILWWYNQYDEGQYRYDPDSDTDYESVYSDAIDRSGMVDKQTWEVHEYECHLYVYLLQTFKVGEAKNPYRFEYFESRNVCTAWEDVFLPIVDAVREQYDIRGRRHYGQLAAFIENLRPSGLAFPEKTAGAGKPAKKTVKKDPGNRLRSGNKEWDDHEKQLRREFPQTGPATERPTLDLACWLRQMKVRAERRKAMKELEGNSVEQTPAKGSSKKAPDQPAGHMRTTSNESIGPIQPMPPLYGGLKRTALNESFTSAKGAKTRIPSLAKKGPSDEIPTQYAADPSKPFPLDERPPIPPRNPARLDTNKTRLRENINCPFVSDRDLSNASLSPTASFVPVPRIVSKESIRAVLEDMSMEPTGNSFEEVNTAVQGASNSDNSLGKFGQGLYKPTGYPVSRAVSSSSTSHLAHSGDLRLNSGPGEGLTNSMTPPPKNRSGIFRHPSCAKRPDPAPEQLRGTQTAAPLAHNVSATTVRGHVRNGSADSDRFAPANSLTGLQRDLLPSQPLIAFNSHHFHRRIPGPIRSRIAMAEVGGLSAPSMGASRRREDVIEYEMEQQGDSRKTFI
ncbi:hypothetical protein K469DRAFT_769212 [Zopfia rhizophila CBS 207.26]|uniref:Uncharacterized protein n=1 Tax=Zopfia rhizophila CBS 207.26 TaxID=1314779 RepID=A0A6A6D753_9PEZI|nr:hypothetical protein K469DRAFT_769212 [Zopfia rhizophila CBS 207.26]